MTEPRTEPDYVIALHIDHKGQTITVDARDEHLAVAGLWVIHVGLSAATLFRRGHVLHGSSVDIGGKLVGIMADSGAGKSALTHFLLRNGARFACDDVVSMRNQGPAIVAYPSVSLYPKLHQDAVDRFGLEVGGLIRAIDTGPPTEEYWVPSAPGERVTAPGELSGIFVLSPVIADVDHLSSPSELVNTMPRKTAARIILQYLQGVWVVGRVLKQQRLENWAQDIANAVPVHILRYVRTAAVLDELRSTIASVIERPDTEATLDGIGGETIDSRVGDSPVFRKSDTATVMLRRCR